MFRKLCYTSKISSKSKDNDSNNAASNKNDTNNNTNKAQHKVITLIAIKNLIFLNNLR